MRQYIDMPSLCERSLGRFASQRLALDNIGWPDARARRKRPGPGRIRDGRGGQYEIQGAARVYLQFVSKFTNQYYCTLLRTSTFIDSIKFVYSLLFLTLGNTLYIWAAAARRWYKSPEIPSLGFFFLFPG